MKFAGAISGCCLDPSSVPPSMNKEYIATLNKETKEKLKSAIFKHMLVPGWTVKGGWKTWLRSIIKAIWDIFGRFFGFKKPDLTLEERLIEYFINMGHDQILAEKMANEIATAFP